jgi:hypothetical protein
MHPATDPVDLGRGPAPDSNLGGSLQHSASAQRDRLCDPTGHAAGARGRDPCRTRSQTGTGSPSAATPSATICNLFGFTHYNNFARGNRGGFCREATMLRDTLAGLIEPILCGAGVHQSRACSSPRCIRHRTIDPQCRENPRPEGAESTLTENARSPCHAEPKTLRCERLSAGADSLPHSG